MPINHPSFDNQTVVTYGDWTNAEHLDLKNGNEMVYRFDGVTR